MKKRPLHELINREEHAWPMVAGWLQAGKNHAEILEARREDADNTLYELQVTTRSPMGAIACETGGILEWEDLQTGYTGFIQWAADGDLAQFYRPMRREGWEEEVRDLHASRGVHFYPPLWAKEGGVAVSSRKAVPMTELWGIAGSH